MNKCQRPPYLIFSPLVIKIVFSYFFQDVMKSYGLSPNLELQSSFNSTLCILNIAFKKSVYFCSFLKFHFIFQYLYLPLSSIKQHPCFILGDPFSSQLMQQTYPASPEIRQLFHQSETARELSPELIVHAWSRLAKKQSMNPALMLWKVNKKEKFLFMFGKCCWILS